MLSNESAIYVYKIYSIRECQLSAERHSIADVDYFLPWIKIALQWRSLSMQAFSITSFENCERFCFSCHLIEHTLILAFVTCCMNACFYLNFNSIERFHKPRFLYAN